MKWYILEPYFKLLAMSVYEKDRYFFPPMKWDNFQSAITCAYTSSLWKHSIQVSADDSFLTFTTFMLLPEVFSAFALNCVFSVSLRLCTDLGVPEVAESNHGQYIAMMLPEWSASSLITKMRSMSAQCAAWLGKGYL